MNACPSADSKRALLSAAASVHSTSLVSRCSHSCGGRFSALLILLALSLFLPSCASMLSPGPPPARLQLAPSMPPQLSAKPLDKQLVVAMPLAGRDIDTDSIALVFHDREVRYLSGVRWVSAVPHMLQRSLIDAFVSANVLRGVTDESAGIAATAKLLCDVRQFSLHYADPKGPPTAVIIAHFRLLNLANGAITGTRIVEVKVPASGSGNLALVSASEAALSRCLAEVVPWASRLMGAAITEQGHVR